MSALPRTLLTVDQGNSACKAHLWTLDAHGAARETAGWRCPNESAGFDELVRGWQAAGEPPVLLCSVAAHALEAQLTSRFGALRLAGPESGLDFDVRAPERLGRDRVFAARGALALARGSALIVDVGSALTVDALRVSGERAVFLGGAIAPGPRLLAGTLADQTARLARVEPRPGVPALGRDTQAALMAGVVHGLRGAAAELVRRIAEETDLVDAPVYLTGGALALLVQPSAFIARPLQVEPNLVHLGLLASIGAHSFEAAK